MPADAARANATRLDEAWQRLTGGHDGAAVALTVKGRTLRVPRAAMGVARFSFHDLCEAAARGAPTISRIAHEFHTLAHRSYSGDGLSTARNEAKRFIILIDTLYDNDVKLVASAAAEP